MARKAKMDRPGRGEVAGYDLVAREFFAIPEVTAVAFQHGDDVLHVWTILREWSEVAAERVYDSELRIMDLFSGPDLLFDFYVVPGSQMLDGFIDQKSAVVIPRANAHN